MFIRDSRVGTYIGIEKIIWQPTYFSNRKYHKNNQGKDWLSNRCYICKGTTSYWMGHSILQFKRNNWVPSQIGQDFLKRTKKIRNVHSIRSKWGMIFRYFFDNSPLNRLNIFFLLPVDRTPSDQAINCWELLVVTRIGVLFWIPEFAMCFEDDPARFEFKDYYNLMSLS